MNEFIYIFTGILAGSFHAISGPDHISAIAPFSLYSKRSSWKIGLNWGAGHSLGVLIVAFIVVMGRNLLPLEFISGYSERIIGAVLIGVGVWGIRKALSKNIHIHDHSHKMISHSHYHIHKNPAKMITGTHEHDHKAAYIGILHGLAGSSHLYGIIPALALPSNLSAALYLLGFGAGTIFSMTFISSLIGYTSNKTSLNFQKNILTAFSSLTIIVGVFWLGK